MSKLNKQGVRPQKNYRTKPAAPKTAVSYNGNPQYAKADKQAYFELLVTFLFGNDTFYESSDQKVKRLRLLTANLVKVNEVDFMANTIKYARMTMDIRTVPVMAAVMLADELRKQDKMYLAMRPLVRDVIQRADQIKDMYAYALTMFGDKKALPTAVKRGVGDAFNKFNEYQFAKYKGNGEGVKLRDVLWLTHPVPVDTLQGELFERIMKDALAKPGTWENELSENGQLDVDEQRSKKDVWTDLIVSHKLGFMALVRNLRNMQEAGVDRTVMKDHVLARIMTREEVLKSKMFPFDLVEAYNAVTDAQIKNALSKAIDLSVENLPLLGENVWVLVDNSSSMHNIPTDRETGRPMGAAPAITASLFAAAVFKRHIQDGRNCVVTTYSNNAKHLTHLDANDSVNTIMMKIMGEIRVPAGTNFDAALRVKGALGFEPDSVVSFSDGQVNYMTRSTEVFKKGCVKVSFTLNGYNSTPLAEENGWYQFSGWTPKVFEFASLMAKKVSIVDALSVPYVPLKPRLPYRPEEKAPKAKKSAKKPIKKEAIQKIEKFHKVTVVGGGEEPRVIIRKTATTRTRTVKAEPVRRWHNQYGSGVIAAKK